MAMGIFTLHRFNGIEQFEITEGKVYAVKNQDKRIMLWLEVETDEQPLCSMPDCGRLQDAPKRRNHRLPGLSTA